MMLKRVLGVWVAACLCARAGGQVVDPRGPVVNVGMNVVVGAGEVQAPGYVYDPKAIAQPKAWEAKWIWLADGGRAAADGGMVAACFRKEISLDAVPRKVTAWLSADAKYRLYVNGRLVSRGPVDIGRDFAGGATGRWFYDARDLSPFFKAGKNVIAAEVFRQWPIGVASRGHGGFLFQAAVDLGGGRSLTVKTDDTWRGIAAPYLTNVPVEGRKGPPVLLYEPGKEPAGWRLEGFDDAAWAGCKVSEDFWQTLIASEIPPLMEARYPVKAVGRVAGGVEVPDGALKEGRPIVVKADGKFSVSFDRVLSAYPTVRVRGGQGALVKIQSNESDGPGSTREADVRLGGGEQFFEFPFIDGLTTVNVQVSGVTTPVEFDDVGATFTSQPVEYKGSFECSDEEFNRLWKVSRWAVQINLQTHHLDSPNHQEPISDSGDYLIESMVNYNAFLQPWLARQDLRKFAWVLKNENYHNFHTSYSLAWLQMLMDYYDHTGDEALVRELSPYVHELMDTYATWRGTNGIISEAPNYMFMDWVTIGGFACHHPPAVIGQGYLTALYYHGMENASRVAALTGDDARVARYKTSRGELAEAFNRELWNPEKGLYRDGKPFVTGVKPYHWLPADKDIETFSPHVNMLAVLYDLAPREKHAGIVGKVLAAGPLNVQPWFMHWVFDAIDHAGLYEQDAAAELKRWKVEEPTQSFREMWGGGDRSHGWCSTPLCQLSERVLGVTPGSPGFKTISIKPTACGLSWAKGVVPTPLGDVRVSWKMGDGGMRCEVEVPAGAEAEVTLPGGKVTRVGAGVSVVR